jgi:hypothetical protein
MKKYRQIAALLLLCNILIFLLTVFDFIALHDIKNDYVSRHILDYLNITLSDSPPTWTATTGEWQIVTISFYSRLIFIIANIIILVMFIRNIKLTENRV